MARDPGAVQRIDHRVDHRRRRTEGAPPVVQRERRTNGGAPDGVGYRVFAVVMTRVTGWDVSSSSIQHEDCSRVNSPLTT